MNTKNDFLKDRSKTIYTIAQTLIKDYAIKTLNTREREILIYNNGVYVRGINQIKSEIEAILEELNSTHITQEIIEKIKNQTLTDIREFEPKPNLINLANGVFDIAQNKLLQHSKEDLFLSKLPIQYDENAICPNYLDFLVKILDKDQIPLIQEILGFTLYPVYFLKKAVIAVGEKDTGKTTWINTIKNMLGSDNISGQSLDQLCENRFSIINLYNKYANIYDELTYKDLRNNATFKMLTGQSPISAERKFGDHINFTNYAKLIFSCNKIPLTRDTNDDAYFDRWIVLEFKNPIPKAEQDPFLEDKIKNELPGILRFAIDGLQRLLINRKFNYEKSTDEIKISMLHTDSLAGFCYDCLFEEQNKFTTSESIYLAYREYCREKNIHSVETQNSLSRYISKNLPYVVNTNKDGKKGWWNVDIKKPNEMTTEQIQDYFNQEDESMTFSRLL